MAGGHPVSVLRASTDADGDCRSGGQGAGVPVPQHADVLDELGWFGDVDVGPDAGLRPPADEEAVAPLVATSTPFRTRALANPHARDAVSDRHRAGPTHDARGSASSVDEATAPDR